MSRFEPCYFWHLLHVHMYTRAIEHMRILVIRFSSIGDIILTSPVLRCLKKQ